MNKLKIFFLLLFVIAIVVSALVLANNWRSNINFNKITITGNYTISREEILNSAHLKEDTVINIEELNIGMIQDRISKHPEIKRVFVSKEPPAELKIEILEKRPVAIINSGNELLLIDEELEIFSFKNYDKIYDLPIINGINIPNIQRPGLGASENDLRLALFIILESYKRGKYLYSYVSQINFSDSSKVKIHSNEKSIPFYLPKYPDKNITDINYQNEIKNKLVVLECFLEQIYAKNISQDLQYVDLRFSNQVVVKYK